MTIHGLQYISDASVLPGGKIRRRKRIASIWNWELFDRLGRLVWFDRNHNTVTFEGQDSLLDIMFKRGVQISNWHVLIFDTDYTPTVADTYAAPGFTEFISYDEAERPLCQLGCIVNQVVTNEDSKASFTMSAGVNTNMVGSALVGGGSVPGTKGDISGSGIMYSAARFSSGPIPMSEAQVLQVTVTLTSEDVPV
jgi:hypothetical protein